MRGKVFNLAMYSCLPGVGKTHLTISMANILHYYWGCRTIVVDCNSMTDHPIYRQREEDLRLYATDDDFNAQAGFDTGLANGEFYPILKSSPETLWNDVTEFLLAKPIDDTQFRIILIDYPSLNESLDFLHIKNFSLVDALLCPWLPSPMNIIKTVYHSNKIIEQINKLKFIPRFQYILSFLNQCDLRRDDHLAIYKYFDSTYTKAVNHYVLNNVVDNRIPYATTVQEGGRLSTISFDLEGTNTPNGYNEYLTTLLHEIDDFLGFTEQERLWRKSLAEYRRRKALQNQNEV